MSGKREKKETIGHKIGWMIGSIICVAIIAGIVIAAVVMPKVKGKETMEAQIQLQDIEKPIGYQLDSNDFITSLEEQSGSYQVEIQNPETIDTQNVGEYTVHFVITDEKGNQIEKTCQLTITYIKKELTIELGTLLTIENLIYDMEKAGNAVNQADIDAINQSGVGEYEIHSEYNGMQNTTKIVVKDTTPPELTLKEVTVYVGQTVEDVNQFVEAIQEKSEFNLIMDTTPDVTKEGTQEITITAEDAYGNKTTQTTKLNVVNDTEGPVFSGLNQMNITVGGSLDYKKDVSANDAKDGKVEFTVDSSKVNLQKAGTYEVTYTAKDQAGNQTTGTRKVVVSEKTTATAKANTTSTGTSANTTDDLDAKADAVIQKVTNASMSMSQKVLALVVYFKNQSNLNYTHRYNEANAGGWRNGAKIALTQKQGDCYIHASVMKLMLERLGIPNYIVKCTDNSHAWNLIQINGVWRHIDSTPKVEHYPNELMTDSRRYETLQWLHPRDWNRSAYPAAK